jgi:flagella basal body P-ring formation protein FlgA
MKSILALATVLLALPGVACAAPELKPEAIVTGEIVTVGDLFTDAGLLAEQPLFRAPQPGTAGMVPVAAIRAAASKIGLSGFGTGDLTAVRVARDATLVDATTLGSLVASEMLARNLVPAGVTIDTRFDIAPNVEAAAEPEPVALIDLDYQPGGRTFSATFRVAGYQNPMRLSGRVQLLVSVPHLSKTIAAGDIITPADVEMKPVAYELATQTGIDSEADVVGKALRRNARAGLMLKLSDLTDPMVVRRNQQVTVLLHAGPMTLSILGTALGDAAAGAPVQVMNTVSHKILTGTATGAGTVEIAAGPRAVAGL